MDATPARNDGSLKVGQYTVDLGTLQPMTLGDKRELFKKHGLNFARLSEFTPEDDPKLVLFILQKLEPKITDADVADLPVTVAQAVMNQVARATQAVDIPFGLRSIPSAGTTAGDQKKSGG